MNSFRKGIIFCFKILAPFVVLLIPILITYGAYSSWEPAEQELTKYGDYYPLLNGISYKGSQGNEVRKRIYLLLNKNNYSSKTLIITKTNNLPYETSIREGGLFSLIAQYLIALLLTWWFWFRKSHITSHGSGRMNAPLS